MGGTSPASPPGRTSPTSAAPGPPPVPAPAAAALLGAVQEAIYRYEVVAGQIVSGPVATVERSPARRSVVTQLRALRGLEAELVPLAGDAATPAPLGYPLPFPVRGATPARRLARRAADDLLAAHGRALGVVATTPTAAPDLVRWTASAQQWLLAWGGARAAFPGLS